MTTLGNNKQHRYLAPLAYSAGRVCLALAFVFGMTGGIAQAASAPGMGSAANFEVLAGTAVTCTNSALSGDVGVYSGTSAAVTQTSCPITGAIHAGDAVASAAYADFLSAYDALAQMPCDQVLTTLDGQVLSPGVYCFDAAATSTGSVLTLDGPANGTWIFKIGTLGTGALTGTNFSVVMADGSPVSCNNVTWWVAEAVTMTDSNFVGTILAGASVTFTRGTYNGNIYAKDAVTITGTTVTACALSGGNAPHPHARCNQGVGNGPEQCDPGNSNQGDPSRSNDELGGIPGAPGRQGGNGK